MALDQQQRPDPVREDSSAARKRRHLSMFGRSIALPGSPTVRIGLGVALCVGGLFAFLPILGLWMIPLGLAILSVDIPWVRRRSSRAAVEFRRRFPRLASKVFPRDR